MRNLNVPSEANEQWAMDLLKMPVTERGNQYVLIVTDVLMRRVMGAALPNKMSSTVAQALYECMIPMHGPPKELFSDRGTEFTGEVYK